MFIEYKFKEKKTKKTNRKNDTLIFTTLITEILIKKDYLYLSTLFITY